MNKTHEENEKNPENHPMYSDEWKTFWNRRYKEMLSGLQLFIISLAFICCLFAVPCISIFPNKNRSRHFDFSNNFVSNCSFKCVFIWRYLHIGRVEKKDPTKHDFKPEWATFWGARMRELHSEAVEKKKTEIRQKLNLPKEGKERSNEAKDRYSNRRSRRSQSNGAPNDGDDARSLSKRDTYRRDRQHRERSRSAERNRRGPDAFKSYDRERERGRERGDRNNSDYSKPDRDRREKVYGRPTSRVEFRDNSRSPLRYEEQEEHSLRNNPYIKPGSSKPYHSYGSRYYGREMSPSRIPKYGEHPSEETEDDSPLTVVTVLRLLSALEELLGPSLGPKVVELLAKALALEKVKANAADELLLNDENCVLLETIKEKLKGQLLSDLVERHRIKAVKKAIKNIAGLVHLASKNDKKPLLELTQNDSSGALGKSATAASSSSGATAAAVATSSSSAANATVNATEDEEKLAISKKIASALVAQGKANISQDELESLVNYYYEKQRKAKEVVQKDVEQRPKSEQMNDNESTSSHASAAKQEAIDLTDVDESESTHNEQEEDDGFGLPLDASNALESLTDSDLQTLLQNFEDLSTEEQTHLHTYMKKLEQSDPQRVEKLRKYVKHTLDDEPSPSMLSHTQRQRNDDKAPDRSANSSDSALTNESKRSSREKSGSNPYDDMFYDDSKDGKPTHIEHIIDSDDDDDDYSFDDVCKAVSKNVRDKKLEANKWVGFFVLNWANFCCRLFKFIYFLW